MPIATETVNPRSTTADTVLVMAGASDTTARQVAAALEKLHCRVWWFDTADFPQRAALSVELDGERWAGLLRGPAGSLELDRVGAVYMRRPGAFVPPVHLTEAERWHAAMESRYGIAGVLASLPVRWCNRPASSADAAYKARQLTDFATCGLAVPPTLVTTNPESVREFAAAHGPIVCKPVAVGVLHTDGGAVAVYTRLLTEADLADLSGLEYAPHLFQAYVPKLYEVRLTVVGEQFFAVRIDAGSPRSRVDWRTDYLALSYELTDTPPEVRAGVLNYLRSADLAYGAFDFVVTPEQEWVALECNPEGQWEWLAYETGAPIAEAIADYLTEGLT
ncbi:MvdC/MvdD family ATP grasp protein [Pseudonocardia aurantiaca]|uniref:MvdC/MvdD family ATP grasp protein n=1 Tax=Pseudonocardia aurantiaca TaxID=75290 RepID=A0ABW4FUA1_9PSEU